MEPFEEGNRNMQRLILEEHPVVTAILEENNDGDGIYYNLEWDPILPIFTWAVTVEDAKQAAREAFDLTFRDHPEFLARVKLEFKIVKLAS